MQERFGDLAGRIDLEEVQETVENVDYPATKQDLIEEARRRNAPDEVVQALEVVEDREFSDPAQVKSAVREAISA